MSRYVVVDDRCYRVSHGEAGTLIGSIARIPKTVCPDLSRPTGGRNVIKLITMGDKYRVRGEIHSYDHPVEYRDPIEVFYREDELHMLDEVMETPQAKAAMAKVKATGEDKYLPPCLVRRRIERLERPGGDPPADEEAFTVDDDARTHGEPVMIGLENDPEPVEERPKKRRFRDK